MKRAITHRKRRRRDDRGVVLLLSLIIMAVLTAAGIGASVVVINEYRTSASTDRGIEAYYSADIGMERGLYAIFSNRLSGSALGGTYCEAYGYYYNSSAFCQVHNAAVFPSSKYYSFTSGDLGSALSLSGGRSFLLSDSTYSESSKTYSLHRDESVPIDLANPNGAFSQPIPSDNKPQALTLKLPDTGGDGWAEVQWTYITSQTRLGTFSAIPVLRLITNQALKDPNGVTIDLCAASLFCPVGTPCEQGIPQASTPTMNCQDIWGYSVRIKATYGDLSDLTVSACKDVLGECPTDKVYPIVGDVNIVARGGAMDARARLDATVPWRIPAAGLFDFVIFSESNLDKPG